MKTFVTGSAGFVAGYLVEELLAAGHEVVGIDNYSKYGPVERSYDKHPRYRLVVGDAKDVELMMELAAGCDQIVAAAAMIGGISLVHSHAYDLLVENERIIASTFDAAIDAFRHHGLQRIVVLSSSMVFESTSTFPTPEGDELSSPPPRSTYGFQKLACEYFAKGACLQFGLPYVICRPFNCIGIGERRAANDGAASTGNIRMATSHVVPDLVRKVLKGQDPLHILGDGGQIRHYTHGSDLARGIRLCIESEEAINEDFNLSTADSTTVLELAELIWTKIHGSSKPFRYECDEPFAYDVRQNIPSVDKARRLLGFEATTPLADALDEIIPWIEQQIELNAI